MIALSAALSLLSVRLWANGGSVDLVIIPIIVFSLRHGTVWGLGAGLIYGLIDCLISGGVGYGWQAIIIDYLLAYSVLGLAGLLPKAPVLAVILGSFARFVMHFISGIVLWAAYMPETYFGMKMTGAWFYSLLYNGSYMLVNCILAVIVIGILSKSTKLIERQS